MAKKAKPEIEKTELEEAHEVIVELNAKVTAAEKAGASGKKLITIGKEDFEVVTPSFHFEGQSYKASDLETDKDLAAAILALEGQNIVKPVNTK